jgi:hypothetical protein
MPGTNRRRTLSAAIALLAASTTLLTGNGTSAGAPATTGQIGVGVTNLAVANVGMNACSINSGGTDHGFDTSCTGNSGNPEAWSADFLAWDWATEGIHTTGLTNQAGGATGATILSYGEINNSAHTASTYRPQPGDAIIFDSGYDYVSIVTAVNPDGSVQTVAGDWGASGGPANTAVAQLTLAAGQTAVGDVPTAMINKTIYAYVSPVPVAGEPTSLAPYGATTWTPPGASQARVDIYAADPHGFLWDYTHTPGTTTPLGTPKQVEAGWTHYTPVGVADFNHDGYPDLIVVDTDTTTLEVFPGTATGLDNLPATLPYSGGWTTNFTPFGVTDWNHTGNYGVLAVQRDTNTLWFYPGDLAGGAGDNNNVHQQIASNWGATLTPVGVGDVTGDGFADILACDSTSNAVWIYPGDGAGGNSPGSEITACNSGQTFFGLTDYNNDHYPDLITRIDATGLVRVAPGPLATVGTTIATGTAATKALQPYGAITWTKPGLSTPQIDIYAANPAGSLLDYTDTPSGQLSTSPKTVETGWTHYRPVGVADFNHDGYPDLITIDTNTTNLEIFTGTATGLSSTPTGFGGGWTDDFVPFGVADYTHAGHYGIIATQISNGTLWFYPGDLTGGAGGPDNYRTQIGVGWGSAYTPVGVGNFAGTPNTDVLTCRTDTNDLSLYPGSDTGSGPNNYATDTEILTGDCTTNTFFGVADYNNDAHPDLIARDNATGNIIVATGDGTGWWQNTTATTITTNW